MKYALGFIASTLLITASAYAQNNSGLPVLDGHLSNVKNVGVIISPPSDANPGLEVHALVQYMGMCSAPTSFVVLKGNNYKYTVIETRTPVPNNVAVCHAHNYITQDVLVDFISNPALKVMNISVNGVVAQ